tara:strand:+ start:1551 stop:1922 length:372 start_codon:yes stop_codon:yes gene_type:complete
MKRSPLKRKTPLKAKAPMKRSSRPKATPIRQSANGQPCQVRVPFICNGDSSTTVLAHLNGAGLALKAHDHEAAYACSACHEWLDGGYVKTHSRAERDLYHLEGVINTQRLLVEQGYKFVKVAA